MIRRLRKFLVLSGAMAICSMVASADVYNVGILSYDSISAGQTEFDITNLTGANSFLPDAPITTMLNLTITNLVVNFVSGPSLTLPGSDFTAVDGQDDLDCTAGACNLFGDNITSAVLTGTLSPTSGISGLDGGDTGLLAAFTATLTPSSGRTLQAGDAVFITATGTSGGGGAVPEPGSSFLLGTVMAGALFAGWRSKRRRLDAA